MTNNKMEIYLSVINTLQNNDHNAAYNEILEDNNNNLDNAYNELIECLEIIIEDLEKDESEFYQEQLNKLNN